MRILYLGSTDLPQTKARAIQIVHTCHALARAGAEVTLAVGRRGAGRVRAGAARVRAGAASSLAAAPPADPPHPAQRRRRVSWRSSRESWQVSYLAGLAAALPFELARRRPDVVFARDLRTARLAAGPAHAIGARLVVRGARAAVVRGGARGRAREIARRRGRPVACARRRGLRAGRPDRDDHRVRAPDPDRRVRRAGRARADGGGRHDGGGLGCTREPPAPPPCARERHAAHRLPLSRARGRGRGTGLPAVRSTTSGSCIPGRGPGWSSRWRRASRRRRS